MLESIQAKNIALIDEAEIEFKDGLNIITGETGAGKSILLSSVQLALGAKADKSLIRKGEEFASVTLVFSPNEKQKKELEEMDIVCEDDMVILQRRIYANKGVCKVNGETVTVKVLQNVAEALIDIHGQREHQSILKASNQQQLLDDYAKEELSQVLIKLESLYEDLKKKEKELSEMVNSDGGNERELDFAKYELDEIEKANLKIGEDFELEEQFEKLSNAQKIEEAVGNSLAILSSDHQGITAQVSVVLRYLSDISGVDSEIDNLAAQLADADNLIQECAQGLDRYLDRFNQDEKALSQVSDRLDLINHLKDKYGRTIEDVLAYADSLSLKIEKLENYENYKASLEKEISLVKESYYKEAKHAQDIREKEAKALSEEMMEALKDLNFEQCIFHVQCDYDENIITKTGCSKVVFYISLNPGEPEKELALVASGGELSRIMLAFKSVFASKDDIGTLVFDEIDSGISGKTAWKVSEKLAVLRKKHQVICITHLPQIAAMADAHFCIEKEVVNDHAKTKVTCLNEDESINEVGRLLGSDVLTDAVIENAKELKNMAAQTKQKV